VRSCATCGTTTAPIRDDGDCYRCHVRGIGFTFVGGAFYGREEFHTTKREALAEHVGEDNLRNGTVERAV
jgi:hypothetical protein